VIQLTGDERSISPEMGKLNYLCFMASLLRVACASLAYQANQAPRITGRGWLSYGDGSRSVCISELAALSHANMAVSFKCGRVVG